MYRNIIASVDSAGVIKINLNIQCTETEIKINNTENTIKINLNIQCTETA